MSFVVAAPDSLASAAAELAGIGSQISQASAAAAAPTSGLLAAAGDEVSAAIAAVFAEHGQAYQGLSAQAVAFHTQFVEAMSGAAGSYAAAEVVNINPLQLLVELTNPFLLVADLQRIGLEIVNAPTNLLFGRALIGDGANGITNGAGIGTAGAPGGFLIGNGGNG
ncbi:MAG: PE family protein, partial [Mycobacterium sp.]